MTNLPVFFCLLLCFLIFVLEHSLASAQQTQQPTLSISIVQGASSPGTVNPFYPPEANLPLANLGSTVVWTNNDNALHTVKSSNGYFDSGIMSPNESFQWTFFNRGYFNYYCALHPYMTGLVIIN